jgi:hypothetical protein
MLRSGADFLVLRRRDTCHIFGETEAGKSWIKSNVMTVTNHYVIQSEYLSEIKDEWRLANLDWEEK